MQKLLDLSVKLQDDYYDCYDVMIITLCDYFGVDGQRTFCWRWGFNYDRNNKKEMESFYDNMYVNRNHDTVCGFMKKFLGLEMHGYPYEHYSDFDEFVRNKIDDNLPVGVVVDTKNCYWNPLFRLQSLQHCALIIGYDNDYYYLKEPYFSEENYVIEKNFFDENLIISVLDFFYKYPEDFDFLQMIKESFLYVDCDNTKYDSMIKYSKDLHKLIEIDLKDDLASKDIRYIPSLRSVKNLASERKGLLKLLQENEELFSESIIELLSKCIEKWQMYLTKLMRVYLTNDQNRIKSLEAIVAEIARIEQCFYNETMELIEQNKLGE